jgi:hypothetical protein
MTCVALSLLAGGCTTVNVDPVYPDRTAADVTRERYFEAIFNRPADAWVAVTPDIQAVREAFEPKPAALVEPRYQLPPALQHSRIFSNSPITMSEVINAIEATSSYKFLIGAGYDLTQTVSINDQFNRIDDLVAYLGRETNAAISVFEESRQILVVPLKTSHEGDVHGQR